MEITKGIFQASQNIYNNNMVVDGKTIKRFRHKINMEKWKC